MIQIIFKILWLLMNIKNMPKKGKNAKAKVWT